MESDLALRNRLQEQGLLDRFEARAIAMAEEAGLEYIQLAGELWTRVVELERVKVVEAGDFQRHAGLRQASDIKGRMLPEPLQQLLSVPGRTPWMTTKRVSRLWTPLDDDERGSVRIVDAIGGEGVQAAGLGGIPGGNRNC